MQIAPRELSELADSAADDAPRTDVMALSVRRLEDMRKLEARIAAAERKIITERQFSKQVKLNAELKELRKQLDDLLKGGLRLHRADDI